ncbi:MAG: winged helix-turn-helix domain-containing protein [Candidatus Verstraetearchaeota archaeon]|nr:winged helix-turn-helix domain-containing protein [Candidatus Verstraetearchaeota archaeon]
MEEEVLKEIESLREGLERLSESLLKAKHDEVRTAFCAEMRRAVKERIKDVVGPEIRALGKSSTCNFRDGCIEQLERTLDYCIDAFAKGNIFNSLATLDRMREILESGGGRCLDDVCTRGALTIVKEVWVLVSIFDRIAGTDSSFFQGAARSYPKQVDEGLVTKQMEPEAVESALQPLSSRWRIGILRLLSERDAKFSDLSRALGLKTGHLQFHLRILLRCGYIMKKRESKSYSISERGKAALAWTEQFALVIRSVHPELT